MNIKYIIKKRVWHVRSMIVLMPYLGKIPLNERLTDAISVRHGIENGWV